MSIDARQFRTALGHFLSGVTVVTTRTESGVRGMTASAFTSLSLDPPLILVCVAKKAAMHGHLRADGRFAISILGAEQAPVSNHFAGYAPDVTVALREDLGETPVVDGALAWLDCAVHQLVDGGDHTIVIGRVDAAGTADGAPLAYWRGKYGTFTPATG